MRDHRLYRTVHLHLGTHKRLMVQAIKHKRSLVEHIDILSEEQDERDKQEALEAAERRAGLRS